MKKINIIHPKFPVVDLTTMPALLSALPKNRCLAHKTRVTLIVPHGAVVKKTRNRRIKQYLRVTIPPFIAHSGDDLKKINEQWYSLTHAYHSLRLRNYYLPKLNTKAVTGKYLYGVTKGIVYSWFSSKVCRAYTTESPTKADLVDIITQGLELYPARGRVLGWTEETYPDHQYLLDIAFHLCPGDDIFQPEETSVFDPRTDYIKWSKK
jgi:hypothetical protein